MIKSDDDYIRNALTWRHQVENVSSFAKNNLPKHKYLEIKYEDLCNNQQEVTFEFIDFLKIQLTKQQLSAEPVVIDTSRNNADSFLSSRSQEVWDICGETAVKIGYSQSGVASELA